MEGGWIKIHQKLLKWEWFDSPGMVSLWIYILLSANWEDRNWHGIIVPRGSLVTSLSSLSEATGLSVKQVRIGLDRLKRANQVAIQRANQYSMITICKYDSYQVIENDEGQSKGQDEGQSKGKRRATPKDIQTYNNNYQPNAPARERKEDWRYVSSVRRSMLNFDADKIAEHKRDLFRAEVDEIAPRIRMSADQVEAFVRYWTEHSKGNDRIRADHEITFDTEVRMRNWMDRDRPRIQTTQRQQQPSRMDAFAADMQYINDFFNGKDNATASPDEQ